MADTTGQSHEGKGGVPAAKSSKPSTDSGKTVLIGLAGGIASAVAFTLYQRMPEEQRERLHEYARSVLAARLGDLRDGLNL